ncbi:MAG: type II CAAX endopeptidase family protein [Litoreibacter sp.]
MVPRTENFEAFIAPARRYPAIWRMILGIISGFLVFLIGAFFVTTLLSRALGIIDVSSPDFISELERAETPEFMIIIFATFIPMALGAITMAAWHKRGLASLLGTRHRFVEFFAKGFAVIVVLTAGYFAIDFITGGLDFVRHLTWTEWSKHLIWAVPLLFIQITAEELVFRGYLQQQLAVCFNSFIWWMILPSLVFALGHFKADLDPVLAVMIVFATFLFGLIAADFTRITGSLGAAMGLHFANNFFSLLVIGVPGQLSGVALFHTPYRMDDAELVAGFLVIDIAILGLIWLIGRRILR